MKRLSVAGLLIVLAWVLMCTPGARADDPVLSHHLRSLLGNGALGRDVTVFVADADTGQPLASINADERQLPASTMKLITAVGAVLSLGKDHRFVTDVVQGDGTGDLILRGGGDPLLTAANLQRLAQRTAEALPASVRGVSVHLDDHVFARPSNAAGWEPGDMPTYVSAVRPLAMLGDYSSQTAMNAMNVYLAALRSQGVRATFAGHARAEASKPIVASVSPHTVAQAIQLMLRVSENNVAETLFRDTAVARGYPGTWEGASAAALEVLRSLGLNTYALTLKDGSGVSMDNRVTARALGTLVARIVDPDQVNLAPIRRWLPVAGKTGTLTYRYLSAPASCARGKVFAKTGSLTGVNTLAGLTRDENGDWRSFAIMVNHRPSAYPNASTSAAIDTLAAAVHGCA